MRWILVALCASVAVHNSAAQGNPQVAAKKSVWTLGIYAGASPLQLRPAPMVANPVVTAADVTDMNVDAVAHPFLVIKDQRYYVFFTAKDLKSDKGGIGLAESSDGIQWKFRRTVIREPFVQSHPFVFEWRNEYYLIPSPGRSRAMHLLDRLAHGRSWQSARSCPAAFHRRTVKRSGVK
jgi:hypothetical protein